MSTSMNKKIGFAILLVAALLAPFCRDGFGLAFRLRDREPQADALIAALQKGYELGQEYINAQLKKQIDKRSPLRQVSRAATPERTASPRQR